MVFEVVILDVGLVTAEAIQKCDLFDAFEELGVLWEVGDEDDRNNGREAGYQSLDLAQYISLHSSMSARDTHHKDPSPSIQTSLSVGLGQEP